MGRHPNFEDMHKRMLEADRRLISGELAFALARARFPPALAMKLLGCSRATFYQWLRGAKPNRGFTPRLNKLIGQLEVCLVYRFLPAETEVQMLAALKQAKQEIINQPELLQVTLNRRDAMYPIAYNSPTPTPENNDNAVYLSPAVMGATGDIPGTGEAGQRQET